ncbi:unnamed protein product [Ixodes persulcatus]
MHKIENTSHLANISVLLMSTSIVVKLKKAFHFIRKNLPTVNVKYYDNFLHHLGFSFSSSFEAIQSHRYKCSHLDTACCSRACEMPLKAGRRTTPEFNFKLSITEKL